MPDTTPETTMVNDTAAQEANDFYSERSNLLADFADLTPEQMEAELGAEFVQESTEDPESPETPTDDTVEPDEDATPEPEETPETPDEPPEPEEDELAKNLEKLQREKKRADAEIAAARQELERERSEWRGQLEEYQQHKQRVNIDPLTVLKSLGFDGDYQSLGRQAWALHKAAEGDPQHKELAARLVKEREQTSEVSELKKQVAELTSFIKSQAAEQQVAGYLDTISTSASDETPLIKNWLANDKAEARQALRRKAAELWETTGEEPDAADVIKSLERDRRAELKKLGIDPTLIKGAKPTPKNTTPDADEKQNGKPLSNDLGNPTPPRSEPQSREDLLASLANEMPWRE